jgi:hypothetical protein
MNTDWGLSGHDAMLIRQVGGMLRHSKATLHLLSPQIEQSGLCHCKAGR